MIDEREREAAKDLAVRAFSTGALTEERLESALAEIMAVAEAPALERIKNELAPLAPATPAAEAPFQSIKAVGASIRRKGRWFTSDRILVESSRSAIRLDFTELRNFPGSVIALRLELEGCICKMVFPRGTEILDELENQASIVRCRSRGENVRSLRVIVTGKAMGSVVKLKASGRA
jgi:hypothetical protein